MALDNANYIDELSITDPAATDLVSQGDDQIRTVKRAVKQSFPSVDIAVNAVHTSSAAPAVSISEGLVWIDTSAGAGNHIIKIYDGSSFITLPFSVEAAQTVDVNAGTIDGTVIGGATPAAITGTTLTGNTSLALATGATVTGVDNGALGTSATLLATQGAIKTYVDAQVGAADLDITTDSGTIDIDLDDDTLSVLGGDSLDTSATGTTVTVNVTDEGITNAKLAHMAANTVKVRDANSTGDPSDKALATTEILIGDGTGFTAAALSSDATMTNAGAVTVAGIQGQSVSATAATNDQYLKYSSASSEWQKVDIVGSDKLTTKGDLLVYNTVDSETRLGVGTNDYAVIADSSATNGLAWKQVATATIADDAVTLAKLEDGTQGDILYYGASGAPTRLGFGVSGQVLKTQGTGANPVWATSSDTTYTAGDGLDLTGTAFSTDLLSNGGLEIQSTELSVAQGISQYDVAQFASGVVDNDYLKIDGTSVEGRSATELLSDVSSIDNSWTGSQRGTPSVVTDGTLDLDTANNFKYTPGAADVLEFTNETSGQSGFITVINPSAYAISLGSEVKKGTSWDVSTAGTYLATYYSDGTNVYVSASEALS
tara:strand:+ start:2347 stop:4149 length:1803 start_codon:yes stop_codon:yes gene_type:complete